MERQKRVTIAPVRRRDGPGTERNDTSQASTSSRSLTSQASKSLTSEVSKSSTSQASTSGSSTTQASNISRSSTFQVSKSSRSSTSQASTSGSSTTQASNISRSSTPQASTSGSSTTQASNISRSSTSQASKSSSWQASKLSRSSTLQASKSPRLSKEKYLMKRVTIVHNYSNEKDLPYHTKEPEKRQAGNWKPLAGRISKIYQADISDSDDSEVEQIFKTECTIGNLRIDDDNTVLYQPIDLHVPRGHKHMIDYITITTPSEDIKNPVVKDNFDGTLSVQFQPKELGLHKLTVTYTNQKSGQISFNVSTKDTTKVIASGSGLTCARIEETTSFDIKTIDAYVGTPLEVPVGRVSPPPSPPPTPPPPPPPPPPKIRKSRCELSLDIPAYSSSIKADIVFAIDSSASVGEKVFKRQLVFVSKIIQNLHIGPDNIHVSILTFASEVYKLFSLNRFHDKKMIYKAIRKAFYVDGKTLTENTLRYIRQFSLSPSRGSRSDCRKLVIFLTDGASTNRIETCEEAEKLRKMENVKIIAIGVGENSNQDGLEALASSKKLVFRESLFDVLFRVLTAINKFAKVDRKDMWGIRISCTDKDDEDPVAMCAIDYTSSMKLTTTITRPSGDKEHFNVGKVNNHEYCISFSVVEAGIHTIGIKNHNQEIPGSPFQFMIDPADRNYESDPEPLSVEHVSSPVPESDTEPLLIEHVPITVSEPGTEPMPTEHALSPVPGSDPELRASEHAPSSVHEPDTEPLPIKHVASLVSERNQEPDTTVKPVVLTVDKNNADPYELRVLSRDRTAGDIVVSIDGPSKASFTYDNQFNGFCKASYKVTVPGIYKISIKCDGQDIKDSPFEVHVFPKCNYVHCEC